MQRRSAVVAAVALAAVAAALYRRVGFRPRERAELRFEDGSTVSLAGSPEVDELSARARDVLAAARA